MKKSSGPILVRRWQFKTVFRRGNATFLKWTNNIASCALMNQCYIGSFQKEALILLVFSKSGANSVGWTSCIWQYSRVDSNCPSMLPANAVVSTALRFIACRVGRVKMPCSRKVWLIITSKRFKFLFKLKLTKMKAYLNILHSVQLNRGKSRYSHF